MKFFLAGLLVFLPLLVQSKALYAARVSATVSVPSVGCPDSEPWGNILPPPGHPINLAISPAIAARLAFYYGAGLFVLAPRGWDCSTGKGNSGSSSLIVEPHGDHDLYGPYVYLGSQDGDDNGVFMVTAYGGTYFPKIFTSKDIGLVIDELKQRGINTTKKEFLVPRFPDDRVNYLSNFVLEFQTPPKKIGVGIVTEYGGPELYFGKASGLSSRISYMPIFGVVGLVKFPDFPGDYAVTFLTIRLPTELSALRSTIQNFTASCQPFDRHSNCAQQIDFVGR